jgi:hypothetical protein
MRRITQAIVTALPLLIAAGSAPAALIDRGGGLIYDSTLNITWLQNANAIAGSSYDDGWSATDGRTSFQSAQAFAATFSYLGSCKWRHILGLASWPKALTWARRAVSQPRHFLGRLRLAI